MFLLWLFLKVYFFFIWAQIKNFKIIPIKLDSRKQFERHINKSNLPFRAGLPTFRITCARGCLFTSYVNLGLPSRRMAVTVPRLERVEAFILNLMDVLHHF